MCCFVQFALFSSVVLTAAAGSDRACETSAQTELMAAAAFSSFKTEVEQLTASKIVVGLLKNTKKY